MTDWPEYESHKVVRAARIDNIVYEGDGAAPLTGTRCYLIVQPGEDHTSWEAWSPTEPAMLARANIGDYAMLYPDGYKSVSPAKAFEEGYTRKP